jgi:hypothetical protein
MSEINSGGNAFPYCVWVGDHHNGHNTGMTLRQWFAGMALQGLLANPSVILKQTDIPELSFEYADSMIRVGKGEEK